MYYPTKLSQAKRLRYCKEFELSDTKFQYFYISGMTQRSDIRHWSVKLM